MERLEAKKIGGRTYYYYSKWGWVNGKCRRLWQRYLGKLKDMARTVEHGLEPDYAEVFDFGLPTALWKEIGNQDIVGHVDRLCPKRKQGLSVGQYIAIAAVNRSIAPVSKSAMWEWFCQTTLRRFLPLADQATLSSQRFWDHMDALDSALAESIWRSMITDVARRENIDLAHISYDGTNFYTFINTFNMKSELARRGKNKQGRNNLRQISYALFCSKDGNVPLYYDLYEGNRNDARQFPLMIERFRGFLGAMSPTIAKDCASGVTVVFDKGNNSKENIRLLDELKLNFIGSVKLDEHRDLSSIPTGDSRFVPCMRPQLEGVKAFRMEKVAYGKKRTAVVVFNPKLFEAQRKTVDRDIEKASGELSDLSRRIGERKTGTTGKRRGMSEEALRKMCDKCLSRQFMKQVIIIRIGAGPKLEYHLDTGRLQTLSDTLLGKKIILTTRDDWNTEDIIEGYHNQYVVEHVFSEMKQRSRGTWWPMNHWTDQKIRIHGLYCTIAILLRALIWRRVRKSGINISMGRLWKELSSVREVVNVFKRKKHTENPQRQTVLTKLNPVQDKILECLELKELSGI
jgi:transposase